MSPQQFAARNGGPSPLAIPGQQQITFQYAAGPLAQPVAVTMQGPGQSITFVTGGQTTRCKIAAQLAHLVSWPRDENDTPRCPTPSELAEAAFDLADAFLQEEFNRVSAERAEAEEARAEAAAASAAADNRTPGGIALP